MNLKSNLKPRDTADDYDVSVEVLRVPESNVSYFIPKIINSRTGRIVWKYEGDNLFYDHKLAREFGINHLGYLINRGKL